MPSARAPLQSGPEGGQKGNEPAALHFWRSQEKQTKGTHVPLPCLPIGGSFSCPGPYPSTQPSVLP